MSPSVGAEETVQLAEKLVAGLKATSTAPVHLAVGIPGKGGEEGRKLGVEKADGADQVEVLVVQVGKEVRLVNSAQWMAGAACVWIVQGLADALRGLALLIQPLAELRHQAVLVEALPFTRDLARRSLANADCDRQLPTPLAKPRWAPLHRWPVTDGALQNQRMGAANKLAMDAVAVSFVLWPGYPHDSPPQLLTLLVASVPSHSVASKELLALDNGLQTL
eukprot:CAMPEP_0117652998 /NCGR_PEP_ID=MMETSP0804-20121206/2947_1 /TAXON_ID=1074897 /ORGANISM="Tetraselmis astigmatica, Strain CCMP880" /LENGTH=220 /DNA_ID=CAMNT_0005459125 /DNA_START=244 /DNA_END=907 /DNA_ORIENTATION=+